jgi:hypothetical protein
VFEIHSDTVAVASRRPNSRRRASVPTTRITWSAIRRWRPHCCIAAAIPMPPRNRKM